METVGQQALNQLLGTVMPYLIVFFGAAILDIVVYQAALYRARMECGTEREARARARGTGWLARIVILMLGITVLTVRNF
ncbi:hypothetical protein ACFPAG_03240 [Vogesella sp. GCM10023246]|uniref:HIG1 domain-containing protein n=1 Tax=Vogesella oryzagri TaxID=3160864 RepID=A0ABV1M0D8_9NEIS